MASCVDCCSMLFVAEQPHACERFPALRDCRAKGTITLSDLMRPISVASAFRIEATCPRQERTALCRASCQKALSGSAPR
jgi:hypothetical protein